MIDECLCTYSMCVCLLTAFYSYSYVMVEFCDLRQQEEWGLDFIVCQTVAAPHLFLLWVSDLVQDVFCGNIVQTQLQHINSID